MKKRGSSNNSLQCVTVISLSCSIKVSSNSVTFEMNKIHKNSTLLLIGVEGYSTPEGKRSANVATATTAEEAARRLPTGSSSLRESVVLTQRQRQSE